jgi:glyoxylase-like metal-dependent hydrolase (beta-lactamase superfamily II)
VNDSIQPRPGTEIADGVRVFQSPLWQTNATVIESDSHVLLCDPAMFVPEIEAIRRYALARPERSATVLLTHADFDHTSGIPYIPEATVVAGEDTAERVANGGAADYLISAGQEWGAQWRSDVRVDRVVSGGSRFECGPWTIEAIPAASHGREGTTFAVLEPGVMFVGDHLSAITIPLLANLTRAIAAMELLVDALHRLDLRLVVPGHGPVHSLPEAREIAEADLAYLRAIREAASEALQEDQPPGEALLYVYAVEPPRPDTPDFAIYGIRTANARLALEEARQGEHHV